MKRHAGNQLPREGGQAPRLAVRVAARLLAGKNMHRALVVHHLPRFSAAVVRSAQRAGRTDHTAQAAGYTLLPVRFSFLRKLQRAARADIQTGPASRLALLAVQAALGIKRRAAGCIVQRPFDEHIDDRRHTRFSSAYALFSTMRFILLKSTSIVPVIARPNTGSTPKPVYSAMQANAVGIHMEPT